ncbi:MAG: VIT domain-containing protein [Polyangiaceae bacterium]
MSTINDKTGLCLQVEENLADVLDGSADAALFEHIADCDACRDLRYDAERAAGVAKSAGADFRAPAGFADSLLAKLDAARPDGPSPAAATSLGRGTARPASLAAVGSVKADGAKLDSGRDAAKSAADKTDSGREATKSLAEKVESAVDIATAPTALAPIESAKTDVSPRAEERVTLPSEATRANEKAEAPAQSGRRTTEIGEQRSSGVAAAVSAHETARSAEQTSARSSDARPAKATEPGDPEPAALKSEKVAVARAADAGSSKGDGSRKGGKVVPFFRRPAFLGAAAVMMAAAAATGFYLKGRTHGPVETANLDEPWSGKVGSVARASADKTGGFEICDAQGQCSAAAQDAVIASGTTLRTDARTRARVSLADGTWVALDRDTELAIAAGKDRAAKLTRGSIVADVANVPQAAPAQIDFGTGTVKVLGTKLQVTAGKGRASVEVARGSVKVAGTSGKWIEVRAGEEATVADKGEPLVASSTSLADVMEWSDQAQEEIDAPVLRGLGELRARKPGDTKEKDRAVHLAKHSVKVRVVDLVARTEVDETFQNDTDEELEGIFRFPLPPGAQIENLTLDVDGKPVQGAFVDRDKGAAIFRGAIQNAAPKQQRPREEIIWVPGPWHDPALLEWQRGGRFELRIFPIPKRSSRRVVLTYTQLVDQSAGVRRFTYPLAHDTSGTTKIDSFDMDVQVLGNDKEAGVTTRGYDLAQASGEGAGDRRVMHADNFTPAGDLTVEYALPDRDKEVTAWAYQMDSFAASTTTPTSGPSGAQPPVKAATADEKAAVDAARTLANDTSPYVAIAVRPKLPRWQEQKDRTHVIIVDTSRSMIGERFARARRLATTIVKEMDRRDSFVLLACDTTCRGMDGSIAPKPQAPGASASADVEKFLDAIEPDGGSDLAAAISAARAAAGSSRDKEVRILYLGDGTPTVGPTRASHLETAVRSAMPPGDGAIVAVALGADADTTSLQALARGGGGVVVPYVPGQKVSTAALEVLSAAYGVVLRDPEIELPQGLTQVTPSRLDPIRAGGESIIVARMSTSGDVTGSIRLRGRVAGERFEQTYPVKIVPTTSSGNAFVPRLFAAAKIAELERTGGELAKPMIVELSKRFAVASQFTSLLVLESQAMFNAFGLDRGSVAPTFTGEVAASSESADADGEEQANPDAPADEAERTEDAKASKGKRDVAADDAFGSGGFGRGAAVSGGSVAAAPAQKAESFGGPSATSAPAATATMAPPRPTTPAKKPALACSPGDPFCFDEVNRPQPRPWTPPPVSRRPLVPMKRVFERRAGFEAVNTVVQDSVTKLAAAESALQAQPDSRDKTVALYALYATMGRIGEAQELTARWSGRDALDPDALLARADLAARQGDRDAAIRILGGLADVRPGDKAVQTRLADLYEAAQNPTRACAHRVALADLAATDAKIVASAVSCARSTGMADLADAIRRDLDDKTRDALDKQLTAAATAPATTVRGDVQLTADWTGAADVDIALIDAQGKRMSWLGNTNNKVTISALNATSTRSESLGFLNLGSGSYVVEISRAGGFGSDRSGGSDRGGFNDIVRGDLTIRMPGGGVRKIPFTLNGARAEIGTVRVFFESKLVPVDGFGFRGGGWR